jgi:hypothetical protein
VSAHYFPLPSIPSHQGRRKFTFYAIAKTAAVDYLQQGTASERQETLPIMNNGHYMTKGHVIACLLYIKTQSDVKKYFGMGREPFWTYKRVLAERLIHPFGACMTDQLSLFRASRVSGSGIFSDQGVFLLTQERVWLWVNFASAPSRTDGPPSPSAGKGMEETTTTNNSITCLYCTFK